MTKIKICGLTRPEDIKAVNRFRPDYCGFIINFPKSRRNLTPDKVRTLCEDLDRKHIIPVGVFVDAPLELVAEMLNDKSIALAQLHGSEDEVYIRTLHDLANAPLIKAFTVKGKNDLSKAVCSEAEYILLDRGQGTGKSFDWSLLKETQENSLKDRSWFLAGGINEYNIRGAIQSLSPTAVDLSSAVETNGYKDSEKIKRIIDIVRSEEQ